MDRRGTRLSLLRDLHRNRLRSYQGLVYKKQQPKRCSLLVSFDVKCNNFQNFESVAGLGFAATLEP